MKFMECQSCRGIVQTNNTGLCLGCQRGFVGILQEDAWKPEPEESVQTEQKLPATSVQDLQKRQQEIEKELANADEIESSESMDACKQAKDGKRVGKGNAKRRKTTKKKGKT